MIIQAGSVTMSGARSYQKTESTMSVSVTSKAEEAIRLDISDQSKGLLKQLQDGEAERKRAEQEENAAKREKQQKVLLNLAEQVKKTESDAQSPVRTQEDLEVALLRRILEGLRRNRKGANGKEDTHLEERFRLLEEQKATITPLKLSFGQNLGIVSISGGTAGSTAVVTGGRVQEWKVQTVTSSFFAEKEVTEFRSMGSVCTADGRELSFGIHLEMSRSFMQETECYTESSFRLVDPLVINLDSNIAEVKDVKFFFDLDGDGKEEEISELGSGSGYLALDKNGDGIVNDGSELFGTKSGDGFLDLAAYDGDGNGWIDEADEVFSKLKIWTKDENGENKLLDLKEAGVGAIYLGSADTRFSLNQEETNTTNAIIRKTGVYLKEDGTAGTLQHVDLAL